jgi:sarcosine oxidase, subunit beta
MHTTEILIVGGGVSGSSIAYHLARVGRAVLVIDRGEIAAEPSASWASAGGVRRQGRHRAEVALAIEASARWNTLEQELDANLDYRRGGNLMLAESDAHAQRLAAFVERQHRNGLSDVVLVDRNQVRELAPGVAEQVVAGSYSPADGHADPVLTTRAFASAAARHGAKYWTNTTCDSLIAEGRRITGARTSRGAVEAETTVIAAGAWSIKLAATVGLDLPLRIEALQMIRSTAASANSLTPVLSSLGRALSLKQLSSGAFLLGGGWLGDLADDDSYRLRPQNVDGNWNEACAILPAVAQQRIERAWCGLEAMSTDDLPIVGLVPQLDGIALAVGFSGHGFAIAPAVGRAVADLIEGKLVAELDGIRPDRFLP